MHLRVSAAFTATAIVSLAAVPAVAQRRAAPAAPAATAPATPPDPSVVAARAAYDAGRQAFDAHDYETALSNFQHAHELRPNPVVLIPIANCEEQLGHIAEAISSLERYLAERTDAPDRAAVQTRLEGLRALPGTLHADSVPAAAHIEIDGTEGSRVTPADVPIAPGHHTVRIVLADHEPASREIDVTPGGRLAVSETLVPIAAVTLPVDPVQPAPRRVSPVVWTGIGVAGAALVTGTVFGFLALGSNTAYNSQPTVETRDAGQTQALVADICFAGTVLAAGVAVIVYFADRGPAHAPPAPATTTAALRLRRPVQPALQLAPTGFALAF